MLIKSVAKAALPLDEGSCVTNLVCVVPKKNSSVQKKIEQEIEQNSSDVVVHPQQDDFLQRVSMLRCGVRLHMCLAAEQSAELDLTEQPRGMEGFVEVVAGCSRVSV